MKILDDMTTLIINDCRSLGIDEYRIDYFQKNELCQNPYKGGDYVLFAYNLKGNDGYSITHWERGRCNFGFGSKNSEDFRFLFQLNIVNNFYSFNLSSATKLRAEEFMKKTKPTFGNCQEYQKALTLFVRTWNDFEVLNC